MIEIFNECHLIPGWVEDFEKKGKSSIDPSIFTSTEISRADILSALEYLNPDNYDNWIKYGMCLKSLGNKGFDIWNEWSNKSEKFDYSNSIEKWKHIKPHSLKIETLFYDARKNGWEGNNNYIAGLRKSNIDFNISTPLQKKNDNLNLCPVSAFDVSKMEFPPIEWFVEGLIGKGLNLLSGSPKLGKSWLCLQLCYLSSIGGNFFGKNIVKSKAIYFALEDSHRRLKNRFMKANFEITEINGNFDIITEFPEKDLNIGKRIQSLEEYIGYNPDTGLVIIDTLTRFAPGLDLNDVSSVTPVVIRLKKIADDYDVTIIVVHHNRKAEAEDYMDMVAGSYGITGVADNILVLHRKRGEAHAQLMTTGRDIEEKTYDIHLNKSMQWEMVGYSENWQKISKTPERMEIVEFLKAQKKDEEFISVSLNEVCEHFPTRKKQSINRNLKELCDNQIIKKVKRGDYCYLEQKASL